MDPEQDRNELNEESLLVDGPTDEERHGVEEFVADGMEDEANVEHPDESAAEEAALRVANATRLG